MDFDIKLELENLDAYLYGAYLACSDGNACSAFLYARTMISELMMKLEARDSDELRKEA
jgi:hypothetical protein